ncbi:MAG: TlpA family protein disulfide reductase [Bryobacterales bacterium]|nr:TlpA family protein disulfide reductase [Bryobacterales bacterium]
MLLRRGILWVTLCASLHGETVAGLWHAAVKAPSEEEAYFDLEVTSQDGGWQGMLINGRDRNVSSSGTFDGRKLKLEFNYWDGRLEADFENGELRGAFTRQYRKQILARPFRARRTPLAAPASAPEVDVGGEWLLDVAENGRKELWLASFAQDGAKLRGVLIPVSGDYGMHTGFVDGNRILLTHFDGIRATILEARVSGGRLEGTLKGSVNAAVTGRRADKTGGQELEASSHTTMKNPKEAFRFSYPDLEGRTVSSADIRFRGKVVVVAITGSWCPNCHDEAVVLRELYERYHARGLEIVALGFEYTGEKERDLRQLRLFAEKYKLPYPVLLAGSTENAEQALDQVHNFRAYPTTLFIGRDGLVRRVHAGFEGPSTGARYAALKQEMTQWVESLLAE